MFQQSRQDKAAHSMPVEMIETSPEIKEV